MKTHWYYKREQRVFGPISSSELRRKAGEEVVDQTTPVRKGSDGPWVPASRVKGLFVPAPESPPKLPDEAPGQPTRGLETPQAVASHGEPGRTADESTGASSRQPPGRLYGWIIGAAAAILVLGLALGLAWSMFSGNQKAADSSVAVQSGEASERETTPLATSSDIASAAVDESVFPSVEEAPASGEADLDAAMLSDLEQALAPDAADNNRDEAAESLPEDGSAANVEPAQAQQSVPSDPEEEDITVGTTGRPADSEAAADSQTLAVPRETKPETPPHEPPAERASEPPGQSAATRSARPPEPRQDDERLAMLRKIYEDNRNLFREVSVKLRQLAVLNTKMDNKKQLGAALTRRLQNSRQPPCKSRGKSRAFSVTLDRVCRPPTIRDNS